MREPIEIVVALVIVERPIGAHENASRRPIARGLRLNPDADLDQVLRLDFAMQERAVIGAVATYAGGTSNGSARFDWAEIVLGVPAGDFNEDGIIDAADYVVWRNTLGQDVTAWDGADGNGNAMVTMDDYQVWRRNFGKTIPDLGFGSPILAVPESCSVLLLLTGCCGWSMGRRAKQAPRAATNLQVSVHA